jgi:hypothetical protein
VPDPFQIHRIHARSRREGADALCPLAGRADTATARNEQGDRGVTAAVGWIIGRGRGRGEGGSVHPDIGYRGGGDEAGSGLACHHKAHNAAAAHTGADETVLITRLPRRCRQRRKKRAGVFAVA